MSQYVAEWPSGYRVAWRNLTLAEYKGFKRRYDSSPFLNPIDVALDVYKKVLVDGPEPNYVPAGIALTICQQQMINNPFGGLYTDIVNSLALARDVVSSNYLLNAKAIIASVLNYKIEEIDNWDPSTFFIRLAQAEVATGKTFDPLKPASKEGNKSPKRKLPLSNAQQKALDRTRERDRRG